MAINLSTVSISLDRFDAVSDGEYNIGHIKLSKDGSDIVRTNRHKTFEFLNKDTIPPEETLAVLSDLSERKTKEEIVQSDGRKVEVDGSKGQFVSEYFRTSCPSYYKRDYFDKMF